MGICRLHDNSLSYDLAMEVIHFFQLDKEIAEQIKNKALVSVSNWETIATKVGLSRAVQQTMAPAFNVYVV